MEHNQKTIPRLVINMPHGSIFVTTAFPTCSSVTEKLAVVERLFYQLMTRFSGRCRCREVQEGQEGVNVWTVRRDKKSCCCYYIKVQKIKMAAKLSQSNFW